MSLVAVGKLSVYVQEDIYNGNEWDVLLLDHNFSDVYHITLNDSCDDLSDLEDFSKSSSRLLKVPQWDCGVFLGKQMNVVTFHQAEKSKTDLPRVMKSVLKFLMTQMFFELYSS